MTPEEFKKVMDTNKVVVKQINEEIKKAKLTTKDKKLLRFIFKTGIIVGQSKEKASNDLYLTKIGNEMSSIITEICKEGGIPVPLDVFEKISLTKDQLKNTKMVVKK